jgi:hypothetical protein
MSLLRGNWEGLSDYLRERFQIHVSVNELEEWAVEGRFAPFPGHAESAYIWLKSRLNDLGFFQGTALHPPELRLTVPLHCFPLYYTTEEERKRLLANEVAAATEEAPARSKVFTTEQIVKPLTGTAAIVSGLDSTGTPSKASEQEKTQKVICQY